MFIVDDIVNAIAGSHAADQQAQQAQKALDLQRQMWTQNSQRQAPFVQGGQQSLSQLLAGLKSGAFNNTVNPQTLANDPGYQFRMQQAQQALSRSAAAKGNLNSGGFMKSLDQYSQGLASQQYQQAWQNQQTTNDTNFGRLYGLAGMGENAASGLGSQGQQYANASSSLYGALGDALAAGTMAIGNGISGGIRDIGSMALMAAFPPAGAASLAQGGGEAPSASSLYASNPGNYNLGNYGSLNLPTQGGY